MTKSLSSNCHKASRVSGALQFDRLIGPGCHNRHSPTGLEDRSMDFAPDTVTEPRGAAK